MRPPDNDSRDTKSFLHDITGFNEVAKITEAIKLTVLQDRLNISNGNLPIKWQSSDAQDEEYEGLAVLKLSYNCISEIPENLPCLCPKLIHLDLQYNQIKSVCFLQSFPLSLKHLNISHNPIEHLNCPEMMAKPLPCTNPNVLQESGFTIYTDEMSFCTHRAHLNLLNLAVLKMSHCWLKVVNFFRPHTLEQHDLNVRSGNSQVGNNSTVGSTATVSALLNPQPQHGSSPNNSKLVCPFLAQLDMSHNDLEKVPESICEMIELNTLDLSSNAITNLPTEMGKLHKLCEFPLYGLKLVYPPRCITEHGKIKDIIGYLWSLLQGLVAKFIKLY